MPDPEVEKMLQSIRAEIDDASIWLDEKFECGMLPFYRTLGRIKYHLNRFDTLVQSDDNSCSSINARIANYRDEIDELSRRAIGYATSRSESGQHRSVRAEHFHLAYWERIFDFGTTSARYLLIAYAAAIITSLTTIATVWEDYRLVLLLSSSVLYFGIGLTASLIYIYIDFMFNLWMQERWRKVADSEGRESSGALVSWCFVIARGLTFGLPVGWLFWGISCMAREIATLKHGGADWMMFLPF